jgi:hypothetical protein
LIRQACGVSTFKSMSRLDDMIVYGDDGPTPVLPRRLGEKRYGSFARSPCDGESYVALKFFNIRHNGPFLRDSRIFIKPVHDIKPIP